MANMTWTAEQKQVIEARNRNLLVSAAAGSGKTAVLVERIIQMVTDPEHPVDIDRLLVMTFTNAAAAEMRERIGDALEKRLEEHPGDRNLERQSTLIHHAKITTIDSFCLGLIREHFNDLDIDPGFRIGDEGELLLLQADVMRDMMEEYYGKNDERFFRFVDTYATGKEDGGLEELIRQVYRFSQSNPWPGEWIEACRKELLAENADDPESFEQSAWMQFLIRDVKRQAEEFEVQLTRAMEIAAGEDGPQAYLPMLAEDRLLMERLKCADSYRAIHKVLSAPTFGRLSAARGKNVDPEKKEAAAEIRNRVKDAVKKMRELYAPESPEHMVSDLIACREPILMLLELSETFAERYQESKAEKNLVDFNDLEHFALKILTGGSADHSPGPAADELSSYYEEILVDEYQDSNEVQETLIRAVSRERFGTPNVFMVGDVKQSIYKFRLAKPELFLEKYESYGKEEGPYQKIELHKNFRSRPEVLDSINDIFFQIMTKPLGNIRYTAETALYAGADYPETPAEGQAKTEVYLLNTGEELFRAMDEEQADYTAKEAEARLIAAKIREITDPETGMQIWNGKTGRYEPLKKKDIVILLRSLSGWSDEFLSVLSAEGIPAFADSKTGYFTAVEVETVLNLLSVIDNPMQDIPLVSVLKSPIVGLTDRELAMIMADFKRNADRGQDPGFYGAVRGYLEARGSDAAGRDRGTEDGIFDKLLHFRELLSKLRREASYLPVHRLIYRIFELTGYYDYVSAMPAGKIRQANLNMLVEKAAAYEKTSYQSLFDFIRYIEKLKKYDTDFGEAARAGENEDTVRIMSIHKSKGLEFPVVFLAGAGKAFNRQDTRGKILIDEELGVAADFLDPELNVKASTLKKNVLSRRIGLESMGEELRILYVAMTRAKEKLIITAGDKYLENRLEKWKTTIKTDEGSGGIPFTFLSAAGSYLDWILMAAQGAGNSVKVTQIPVRDLIAAEVKKQEDKAELRLKLRLLRETEGEREDLSSMLLYRYPHEADVTLHAKMSVSELKHQGQFTDDGESDFLPSIPDFMRTGDETEDHPAAGAVPGGAIRGTVYHRVLELLNFCGIRSYQELNTALRQLEEDGLMPAEALRLVDRRKLLKFFESPLAGRMRRAEEYGKLHKESQFVMGIPARQMDEADSDEPVLIQGIIDAWFEEEDGIVLVDYKTDRVGEGEEQVLLDRYQIQLVYYAQALTQITGKKVKESFIYSLTLQKQISVF